MCVVCVNLPNPKMKLSHPSHLPSSSSPALPEVPPIPCHVHCGEVVNGRCGCGQGKTEAYFFPPLDVPPYNLQLGPVKTRLGLQSHITREEVSEGGGSR